MKTKIYLEEGERVQDIINILNYFYIAAILSIIMSGGSYIVGVRRPEAEKVSVYECGFDPFNDSRQKFEVRFFLVGILFIIFDLEISFFFPWAVGVKVDNYWAMMVLTVILTLGLIYEWNKGGLEWE